jgi:AraC-like DNA-binding protein
MVMDRALLDAPLRWADPDAGPANVADLDGLQRGIRRATRCSDWAVMMLREAEGTRPALGELAALLCVSPRTLTRHLANEGLALRDLAKDVRHQRACEMLKEPRQPISEIAWRLGYSDPTNFSHAFSAASGVSPRQYREGAQRKMRMERPTTIAQWSRSVRTDDNPTRQDRLGRNSS